MGERGSVIGRTAVITGAAGGIGRALALKAAAEGMAVAAVDIDEAGLSDLASALDTAGAQHLMQIVDVSNTEAVVAFAEAVSAWAPSIALVFVNAGIQKLIDGLRPDLQAWRQVIDVNLYGTVNMVHAFMGRLLDRPEWSQIVIMGSQASFIVAPGMAPYVATKHALWGLADTLRAELAHTDGHVGISLCAPGRVRSGITLDRKQLILDEQGSAAAERYERLLVDPAEAAALMFDQAVAGRFWIVPSAAPYSDLVRARVEELLAAEASGRLEVERQPSGSA